MTGWLGVSGAAWSTIATPVRTPTSVWSLFVGSFDVFTVLLLCGSITGVTVVLLCLFDVRERRILPPDSVRRARELAAAQRWDDLRDFARDDDSFIGRVLNASLVRARGDRVAMREAAELAASEESARWFRRIEVLNVVGNLGPLVGLAGTVWGMILAFTSLGVTGGQAGPADLSLGISKALFHTLLGLCLAIPCLLVYGIYRGVVDRICTRGMMLASEIVEKAPGEGAGEPGVLRAAGTGR